MDRSNRDAQVSNESFDSIMIKLIVETLTGKSLPIFVSKDDQVHAIKSKIQLLEGIPIAEQNLLYRKEELEDWRKISDLNLKYGAVLQLVLAMRGGPISLRRFYQSNSFVCCHLAWNEIKDFFFSSLLNVCEQLPKGTKVSLFLITHEQSVRLVTVFYKLQGAKINASKLIEGFSGNNQREGMSSTSTLNPSLKLIDKITNLKLKIDRLISARSDEINSNSSPIFSHNNIYPEKKNAHAMPPMTIIEDVEPGEDDVDDESSQQMENGESVRKPASIECLPSASETTSSTPSTSLLIRSASMSQLPYLSRPSQNRFKIVAKFVLENDFIEDQQHDFEKLYEKPSSSLPSSPTKKITKNYQVPNTNTKSNLQKMRFASVSAPKIDTTNWSTNLVNLQCESASKLDTLRIAKTERLLGCRVSDSELNRENIMPKFGRRASFAPNTEPRKYREQSGFSNLGFVANIERIENTNQVAEEEIAYEIVDNKTITENTQNESVMTNVVGSLLNKNCHHPVVTTVKSVIATSESDPMKKSIMKTKMPPMMPSSTLSASSSTSSKSSTSSSDLKKNGSSKNSARNRCSFCNKRINITNMHTCRCGSKFCAAHRYAEVHGCNYDYKTEGREWLTKNNPVIVAPKIAKI